MGRLKYMIAVLRSKFHKKPKKYEIINDYFRKGGAHIGTNCKIGSNLDSCEKQLLTIGNNVIISTDVIFVTHDVSISIFTHKKGTLFGKINIGNDCFIGERATILYGVTLADSILVAAGAVVTKSFYESGVIIGGNPAKVIGNITDFSDKYVEKLMLIPELEKAIKTSDERLIER